MADQLVVLNKDEDSISVIDVDDGATVATVETAFNPHEVTLDPAGERAFVTCSLGGQLLVFDTDGWERRDTIEHEHFAFPHGLALRPSANELWLVATRSSHVFVYDLDDRSLLEAFPTHQDKSHMVAIDADDRFAYIANIGSDSVTVVDCAARRLVADPLVGESPEGIAVHPDAGVLVANQDDDYLSVLDPETLEETSRTMLGETPVRVVLTPDESTALVANRKGNDLSIVDCAYPYGGEERPWEVARVPVGIWPGGTAVAPDGRLAYVANNKTNDVSVVDIAAREEIDRFDAGIHPDGIAYLAR